MKDPSEEAEGEEAPVETKLEEIEYGTEGHLRKELEEERTKANTYLNQLKVLKADFENFQKRTKREMDELVKLGNERLIVALLGVIDTLELAIEAGKKSDNKEELVKGVEMVLNGLMETLRREGLAEIEANGKPFDPRKHEVVDQTSTDTFEDETVIAVLRKGYTLSGRVIRPSMVRVAKNESVGKKTQSCEDPGRNSYG